MKCRAVLLKPRLIICLAFFSFCSMACMRERNHRSYPERHGMRCSVQILHSDSLSVAGHSFRHAKLESKTEKEA